MDSCVKKLTVQCEGGPNPILERAAEVLKREILERTGIETPHIAGGGGITLTLAVDPMLPSEAFRIKDAESREIRIEGGSSRAVVYGIGRFLRNSQFGEAVLSPCTWRGISSPEKPYRCIYFATHFHNFYHNAPITEVQRYIEELAMWGFNVLNLWFDMHHYRGIKDPGAQVMLKRLRSMVSTARRIGMNAGIGVLANESYADTPEVLRAKPTQRSHYGVEICPSQPGGPELILSNIAEELDAFADIGLDVLGIWPYDQGGCGCEKCAPWGANGFLRMGEAISHLARQRFPNIKITLSTWLFDSSPPLGEWEGLSKKFAQKPDWVDYLVVDSHEDFPEYPIKHGAPGGLPMINFPEISMWMNMPWGGYGANPLPSRFQNFWDNIGGLIAGGSPYSEGIFEDVNKVLISQFYWNGRLAADTLREYLGYEFGQENTAELMEIVLSMEANHPRQILMVFTDGQEGPYGYRRTKARTDKYRFDILNADWTRVEAAWKTVTRVDKRLSPRTKNSWRWRLLFLRAKIDHEIHKSEGRPSDELEACFEELCELYHSKETTCYVAPPTRENILHAKTQNE